MQQANPLLSPIFKKLAHNCYSYRAKGPTLLTYKNLTPCNFHYDKKMKKLKEQFYEYIEKP